MAGVELAALLCPLSLVQEEGLPVITVISNTMENYSTKIYL